MQQPDDKHTNENQHTNPRLSSTTPSATASRKQGIICNLPAPWIPYAELMRLDRPAGFYAFYIPYLIGLSYGACLADPIPSPTRLSTLGGIFFIGCIILRGAACAWNDNVDQEFDRKVARCQNRPIARGAISTTQGHVFTAALTLAGAPLFIFLPVECSYHAVPITILFGAYALMKRITNYPQVVLGFPFAWGILMSCAALEIHPLGERFRVPTLSLFVANILWTMIYDTVYAHQDIKDDVKAGVKSMAVRFADSTKTLASTLAAIQVGLLIVVGWQADFSLIYFLGTCGGSAVALGSMLARVDLKEPASCAWFFHRGFWYVGGSIVVGLFGEYLARLQGLEVPQVGAFI
ncbi:hypothetical protein N7G274_004361 [Stereocaulon virgatum]|uniref:4-hydroxybenzoate polyprenyltransferase, mitochondrial n=1 Tax=Stereocaulon virgatum TaxID=373712 RepID=A0ABR4ADI9_9LECA